MRRKICAIGNSRGVSLPIEALEKLKLAVGSEVDVQVDEEQGCIVIEPVRTAAYPEGVDAEFANQVNEFIELYRPALKKLAE
ncbi:AbrB/MazE/SpoVT family DNA-binding domain-containing protein [Geobacter sp. DSM 9736]|uniref:AbrB/MazE/SpoVT family DNA-binding domain-containing protein n=1 Tax=Geobacter sp. DSM 9736 TaxID=1277350 RepID=UPI000B50D4A3|nr:AbrB/MazE/SpoVT family DNA-binding domain-containing protein [Geobacter sp. DSM 9736]SNB47103.1 putative addiction module antidote [Geobacter sp. DSM 9736]